MVGEGANVWIWTNSGLNLRLAYTLDPPSGDQLVCASLACSADGRKVAIGTANVGGIDYTHVAAATSADSGAT